MRVFITGATGYIGLAVVQELLEAGHEVVGLARSEESAGSLIELGAQSHIGSIEDLDGLRRGAAGANAVIHLAFFHSISHMALPRRLKVLLGGSPAGIVSRFTATATEAEVRAIEALGSALTGSDSALVAAFPTMALTPGRLATEDNAADAGAPGGSRVPSEKAVLSLASRGIRASLVRLPPCVHDEQRAGLATRMSDIAKKKRVSAYIDGGENRWAAVHRLDAARLFRMAVERGVAGARYHAVAEENLRMKNIAACIGQRLDLPTSSMSPLEARKHFGWLASFVAADNPVSSSLTQERLGWTPANPTLMDDICGAPVRVSRPLSTSTARIQD
jgi:nucleoside-diphosphate-sugar epimerase